jgi:hypothetical protein
MNVFFRHGPGFIRKNFVKLRQSLDLGVDLLQAENEPFERATVKEELFLENVEEVLTFVAADSHDGNVVVDVLRKYVALGVAVEVFVAALVVVHQQALALVEVLQVPRKPRQDSVVFK